MKKVAIIKGDGTGPELIDATLRVLEASGAKVELMPCDAGADWWQKHDGPSFIPEESWKILEKADCALKGPTTTLPTPGTPRSVAVSIRQRFGLYANVRPVKTFPNHIGPLGAVDFVLVREATEGLYAGIESKLTEDVAMAIRLVTREKSTKVAKFSFEEAKRRKWRKVVALSKANILKITDGLFLESVRDVAKRYPGIELEDMFLDNFAQQLVKNPQRFNRNVIVSTNLFMDVMSEEASALIGSIGMVYSGNFGDDYAMFEPAHGSSPKYKGKNKVNPTATILSAAWMLDYVGESRAANAIRRATVKVISEGNHLTYDMGGTTGTKGMAQAVAALL